LGKNGGKNEKKQLTGPVVVVKAFEQNIFELTSFGNSLFLFIPSLCTPIRAAV